VSKVRNRVGTLRSGCVGANQGDVQARVRESGAEEWHIRSNTVAQADQDFLAV
jgi:hypothetical protein